MSDIDLYRELATLRREVENLRASLGGAFVPLTAPLTSTAWDGDARSTTAKTLIDLSAVFGAPAGVRAVLASVLARDSGSAGAATCDFQLAPNDTNNQAAVWVRLAGLVNDTWTSEQGVVPCNADGDIYYQVRATGASTLDVIIEIWGYWI